MESQGRDIKMDEKRVEGYRNFATKLWNASRFAQANGIGGADTIEPPAATLAVNKWIVAETVATVQAVDLALADYRFDAAANAIYQFVWSRFCDWYLELIKGNIDAETKAVAGWVLDQILILLHPFMPFITEELWHALAPKETGREHELIVAQWPMPDARALDPAAVRAVERLIELVESVRAARAELNVPPGAKIALHTGAGAVPADIAPYVERLARVTLTAGEASGARAPILWGAETFALALDGVIDLDAERARLTKSLAAAEKERDALAGRLGNASFVERAKPEAVEKARADHAEKSADAERFTAALARLG
ncbi:class I tRNA ligase family protein, partial [Sphingomonas ginsenosidimutans]|uniref:class I tRNA ligase family protein n=3 Tax=Sphingomonas TaxID=13687 RepID=UPI001E02AD00